MSVNINQVRRYIVVPTLHELGLYSKSAERLVLATGMAESKFSYIDQVERGGDLKPGPAYGFFQMERATHDDIHRNYLRYKNELSKKIRTTMIIKSTKAEQMQGNAYYAAAMCRVHYLRVRQALPAPNDIEGFARYWKKYYNTYKGAGTIDGFIQKTMPVWDLYNDA